MFQLSNLFCVLLICLFCSEINRTKSSFIGSSYFQATHENKDVQTRTRKTVFETLKNCGHCENVQDWDLQELVTFLHCETRMNSVVSFANGFKDQNTLLFKYAH